MPKGLPLLAVGCALLLQASPAPATNYYVSPTGNDANSGASNAPWQTTGKVSTTTFKPGDRILFKGGAIFGGRVFIGAPSKGTAQAPITIGSYGTGRATIAAGNGAGLFVYNCGGVVVNNLYFSGSGRTTNTDHGVNVLNDGAAGNTLEYLRFTDVEISGFGVNGFTLGSTGANKFNDVRLVSVISHDNGNNGIFTYAAATATHSNFYLGDCFSFNNAGIAGQGDSAGNGILLGYVNGGTIERCVAYHNGFETQGAVGIWTYESTGVTIQFNESHHNRTAGLTDGGGFGLDGGVTNSVMQYNYSHDNDGAGFGVFQFPGASAYGNNVFRYNISQNDGRKHNKGGFVVWDGEGDMNGVDIHNNTIFSGATPTSTSPALLVMSPTTNLRVRNNIFVTTGGLPLIKVAAGQIGALFQGNDYWSSGGPFLIQWAGVNYSSLPSWRSASGQERVVTGGVTKYTGFSVDPRLTAPGAGGTLDNPDLLRSLAAYQLQQNSPLIDKGLHLPSQFGINPGTRDFYGSAVPQGTGFELGAHELALLLTDDFNDNVQDTAKWTVGTIQGALYAGPAGWDPAIQVIEQNARLEISPRAGVTGDRYSGYVAVAGQDFTGAAGSVEVPQIAAGGGTDTSFALCADSQNFVMILAEKGKLYFEQTVNGVPTAGSAVYAPSQHRFWRIRHIIASDTIIFDTSATGASWTQRRSVPRQIPITSLKVELSAGTYQAEAAPGTAIFDNFKLLK